MRTSKSWREPKRLTPETLLKRAIKQYLSIRGYFHFPVLQGLGAVRGIPDIIALKNGRCLMIEVKAAKGVLSPHQEAFKLRVEEAGGEYLVVRSVDDLIGNGI